MSQNAGPLGQVVTEAGDYLFVPETCGQKQTRKPSRSNLAKLPLDEVIGEAGPVVHVQGTAARPPRAGGPRRPKKSARK